MSLKFVKATILEYCYRCSSLTTGNRGTGEMIRNALIALDKKILWSGACNRHRIWITTKTEAHQFIFRRFLFLLSKYYEEICTTDKYVHMGRMIDDSCFKEYES